MKTLKVFSIALFFIISIVFSGCKKEESENLKFIGSYTVDEACVSINCSGNDNFTMAIRAGNTDASVVIDNFANGFNGVKADVSGTLMVIRFTGNIYHNNSGTFWDILDGSGTLSNNRLSLSYNFNDILYNLSCGQVECASTAIKQ